MDTDRPVPTPEETFRQRLREAREAQRLSQRALVARLADLGQDINHSAITRIERGERKVSLDEAIALAAALDVAPVHLFLPIKGDQSLVDETGGFRREGPPVRLAPGLEVDQVKARRWARGAIPLHPENFMSYLDQSPGDIEPSTEGMTEDEVGEFLAEREVLMRAPIEQQRAERKREERGDVE